MVALDLDNTLRGLFQQVVRCLENIPKPQGENISAVMCDLSVRCLLFNTFELLFLVIKCLDIYGISKPSSMITNLVTDLVKQLSSNT